MGTKSMKWLTKMFKSLFEHHHCFCNKKLDETLENGDRLIIMACNRCGFEDIHVFKKERS